MKTADILDRPILELLDSRQGEWTSLWMGHFNGREKELHMGREIGVVYDVYNAMPKDLPEKLARSKMKSMVRRGLVTGCCCGCRGDFEITDAGLEVLGRPRTKRPIG